MRTRASSWLPFLSLALLAGGLVACDRPSNPPMAGTSQGAAPDNTLAGAAGESAGRGCIPTSQGLPRLATRGEGPVVLRSGQASGSVARGGVQQPPQVGDSCP